MSKEITIYKDKNNQTRITIPSVISSMMGLKTGQKAELNIIDYNKLLIKITPSQNKSD